jgi:DNA-binding transcriptional MerR regulator
MADTHEGSYLSIGEVLGLLLEEFPDVTISKIRFLESQGLISPERTPSGYRKFFDTDVELLRVILTEQKENYLPLRVIKDRIENGEIDPSGEHHRPGATPPHGTPVDDAPDDPDPTPAEVPSDAIANHPAARHASTNGATPSPSGDADQPDQPSDDVAPPEPLETSAEPEPEPEPEPESESVLAQLLPGVLLDRTEFCGMVGLSPSELEQLESFGIVHPRNNGAGPMYDDDAVAIAKPAAEFLRAGIDARHLRNWRTSAEREASLYEQIVTPRFRQRNPEARVEALHQLRRLDELGATLRSAMTRQALRHHFDG